MGITVGGVIIFLLIICFFFSQQIGTFILIASGIIILIGFIAMLITQSFSGGIAFVIVGVVIGIIGLFVYFDHEPLINDTYSFSPAYTVDVDESGISTSGNYKADYIE